MAEEKKYIIGDFEYISHGPESVRVMEYVGPTGPGSIAAIPAKVEIDGEVRNIWNSYYTVLDGKQIEKLIWKGGDSIRIPYMPILKEVEIEASEVYSVEIKNCPELQTVVVKGKITEPVTIDATPVKPLRIEYHHAVKDSVTFRGEELKLTGDNMHVIFGDEVEEVGIIRGGHVTLGKGIKEVKALKKADFGLRADTTVAEYELPTRIDFLSELPPVVGSVAPGSMTVAELHVPAGALDAYMSHLQWGKAAYFVEEGGKTVDKYAAKHKARLKKSQKENEKAQAEAAEKAKKEKVEAMGAMMHSTLATQRLAKWNPKLKYDLSDRLVFLVEVTPLMLDLTVPKSAPIDIWDKIVDKLESVEQQLI